MRRSQPVQTIVVLITLVLTSLACSTGTPAPTKAVLPTAVPPQKEVNRATYKSESLSHMDALIFELEIMQDSLASAQQNVDLLTSIKWQDELLEAMDAAYEELEALTAMKPPSGYEEVYYYLVSARDEFKIGRDEMRRGILDFDYDSYHSALVHFDNFNQSFMYAAEVLDSANESLK